MLLIRLRVLLCETWGSGSLLVTFLDSRRSASGDFCGGVELLVFVAWMHSLKVVRLYTLFLTVASCFRSTKALQRVPAMPPLSRARPVAQA
ncbi:hypothetical protein CSUI_007106 [Cystoisospora suis]|uniref:Uncharacterized protein n=1 Tax=Cystoisospora suis TaxID=483139 RepID=A0A2C6KNF3_9APIC|nr:hypothetical protein CSUI_007106 [Cystoisospora suis]